MSGNIKIVSVAINPVNKSGYFTSGDQLTGQISLQLDGDSKINSLSIKMKGKAEVQWTEHSGSTSVTYYDKQKYFSVTQFIIPEEQGNNMVQQGSHVYPFTFQIPEQELPSSFRGAHGKIRYTVTAVLSRPMRLDSKDKAEFTVLHRGNPNTDPSLMTPQNCIVDKKMKLFTSGTVGMDVNIPQIGYKQGEGITVVTSIQNKCSRAIRPKYCLYSKYSYFAKRKRKVQTKDILKEVGEDVPPSAGQTVTRIITIPPSMQVSVLNCNIIKVEYRLRIYLDVKYASDPVIKFPIIILPTLEACDEEQPSAYAAYGFNVFGNVDVPGATSFPPKPAAPGPYGPPPPYGTYNMYPILNGFDWTN
ncbi:arrestin domain-containing protein 3-like [Cynoglossus semilaevis]|uniref:arrestin domain-containing protein 3-like n=1 Tax=Cynoglossus semilaevis TaxID=244447 RepID=UPI000D626F0C|nr:arrestin domain-containing protein 3-like [Cynoglossus semilaevis]